MLERVATRTTNPYGKSAEDRAAIRRNFAEIQPLLKLVADFEVDSSLMSVERIVDCLIELALG